MNDCSVTKRNKPGAPVPGLCSSPADTLLPSEVIGQRQCPAEEWPSCPHAAALAAAPGVKPRGASSPTVSYLRFILPVCLLMGLPCLHPRGLIASHLSKCAPGLKGVYRSVHIPESLTGPCCLWSVKTSVCLCFSSSLLHHLHLLPVASPRLPASCSPTRCLAVAAWGLQEDGGKGAKPSPDGRLSSELSYF